MTSTTARVCGTDLRRAGYECDWGRCPVTGPQLYGWAHSNCRKHPEIIRRLMRWGDDTGHGGAVVRWSPAAVAAALRWLADSPE